MYATFSAQVIPVRWDIFTFPAGDSGPSGHISYSLHRIQNVTQYIQDH